MKIATIVMSIALVGVFAQANEPAAHTAAPAPAVAASPAVAAEGSSSKTTEVKEKHGKGKHKKTVKSEEKSETAH